MLENKNLSEKAFPQRKNAADLNAIASATANFQESKEQAEIKLTLAKKIEKEPILEVSKSGSSFSRLLDSLVEKKYLIGTFVVCSCLFPQAALVGLGIGAAFATLKYFANKLDGVPNKNGFVESIFDNALLASALTGVISSSFFIAVPAVVIFTGLAISSGITNFKQNNLYNAGLDLATLGLISFSGRQMFQRGDFSKFASQLGQFVNKPKVSLAPDLVNPETTFALEMKPTEVVPANEIPPSSTDFPSVGNDGGSGLLVNAGVGNRSIVSPLLLKTVEPVISAQSTVNQLAITNPRLPLSIPNIETKTESELLNPSTVIIPLPLETPKQVIEFDSPRDGFEKNNPKDNKTANPNLTREQIDEILDELFSYFDEELGKEVDLSSLEELLRNGDLGGAKKEIENLIQVQQEREYFISELNKLEAKVNQQKHGKSSFSPIASDEPKKSQEPEDERNNEAAVLKEVGEVLFAPEEEVTLEQLQVAFDKTLKLLSPQLNDNADLLKVATLNELALRIVILDPKSSKNLVTLLHIFNNISILDFSLEEIIGIIYGEERIQSYFAQALRKLIEVDLLEPDKANNTELIVYLAQLPLPREFLEDLAVLLLTENISKLENANCLENTILFLFYVFDAHTPMLPVDFQAYGPLAHSFEKKYLLQLIDVAKDLKSPVPRSYITAFIKVNFPIAFQEIKEEKLAELKQALSADNQDPQAFYPPIIGALEAYLKIIAVAGDFESLNTEIRNAFGTLTSKQRGILDAVLDSDVYRNRFSEIILNSFVNNMSILASNANGIEQYLKRIHSTAIAVDEIFFFKGELSRKIAIHCLISVNANREGLLWEKLVKNNDPNFSARINHMDLLEKAIVGEFADGIVFKNEDLIKRIKKQARALIMLGEIDKTSQLLSFYKIEGQVIREILAEVVREIFIYQRDDDFIEQTLLRAIDLLDKVANDSDLEKEEIHFNFLRAAYLSFLINCDFEKAERVKKIAESSSGNTFIDNNWEMFNAEIILYLLKEFGHLANALQVFEKIFPKADPSLRNARNIVRRQIYQNIPEILDKCAGSNVERRETVARKIGEGFGFSREKRKVIKDQANMDQDD